MKNKHQIWDDEKIKGDYRGNLYDSEEKTGKYERVYSGFLNLFLGVLSYFIPKNSNQVLLGSYLFVGNPKYFFLYLAKVKRNEYRPVWITRSKKIYSKLQADGLSVVYLKSWKGFFSILRSKYLLFSHGSRDVSYLMWLPGRFNKILLAHGSATKHLAEPRRVPKNLPTYNKIIERLVIHDENTYHTILTCSEKTKKRDEIKYQNKNVKILGFPRNDIFFNRNYIYEDFSIKLDLRKYNKVIIFCPTWRESNFGGHYGSKTPFSNDFLGKFNQYLKNKNYIMLCKKHKDEKSNRFDFSDYTNIKNISKKIDIQDLLIDIDIMITDYSSVLKDFCLTGKPIIFYPFDYEDYIKDKPMYTDYFNEFPGPFAKTEEELLNHLENLEAIISDNEYIEKYRQLVEANHSYQDGKSCERLCDCLFKKN